MNNDNLFETIQFPKVKNIFPKLLSDDIQPLTSETVGEAMAKMFQKFEEQTGFKVIVIGNDSPVSVLIPEEHITPTTKE